MNVLPAGRRGKANRTCWREVWPHPAGSVCEVATPGEGARAAALTPNASFPLTMEPVSLSMLATLSYFGFFLSVVALALRAIARHDPDESVPPRMMPNLHADDEPYLRERE
jgi:hypothetical protein